MNPRLLLAVLTLLPVSLAGAAVVPIDPFLGDLTEGFENVLPPGGYPGPIDIFEGNATMDDTLAHTVVISFIWSGPGGSNELLPYNGNLFSGAVAGSAIFEFPTPITQFGGYFGTVGPNPGGNVTFRDTLGNVIDTVSMNVQPGQWGWEGWSSDVPVGSIEVISNNIPMQSTQFDDLQLTFVPEPGTVGLVLLGLAGVLRRR